MHNQKQIIEAIKTGMKRACQAMHSFTDEPALAFNAEYLFTVNTANAIDEHNYVPAHAYEIRIEQSTKKFARDCLLPFKFGHPLVRGSTKRRSKVPPKIDRNGRIDIAVYHDSPKSGYFGRQPLCAIELKGFDPARKLVMDDLRRNLEFMRLEGDTGASVLGFVVFAALHETPVPQNLHEAFVKEVEVKKKYQRWLAGLGQRSDVVESVETFGVSWEPDGTIKEEVCEYVLDTSTRHHFVGAIVTFSRLA
ncbi:hypothetical protein [Glaciimonas soli]|uniref:Uncharacterized protein n=1 Tax=Glaciimonas soli TaxID=2590999 RepID=A0A843YNE0_9BURK|nr:hypothetical protein [Glaciimonas soli]MQR00985.1 hypothetical protein [Glaciimonas soli]